MKVLVTGASGFIGHRLAEALAKKGHRVRCLVRDEEKASQLRKIEGVEIHIGDITKPDSIKGVAKGVEAVFHLAALMGHDPPSEKAFQRFREINTRGAVRVLKECREKPLSKFVFFSTTAVLGIPKKEVVTEEYLPRPHTPYQVSKYEAEKEILQLSKEYRIPAVIIRPCKIYGPGFVGDFLTIAKLVKKGVFPILGRGENLYPALFVDDLIKGALLVLEKGKEGEIYHLAGNRSFPLKEIIITIKTHLGAKGVWIYLPRPLAQTGALLLEALAKALGKKPPVTLRNITSVTTNRTFSIAKAKKDLGFSPRADLGRELKRTLDWFMEEGHL